MYRIHYAKAWWANWLLGWYILYREIKELLHFDKTEPRMQICAARVLSQYHEWTGAHTGSDRDTRFCVITENKCLRQEK